MISRFHFVFGMQLWQWGFFLAGLGAIYIVSALAGHIIVYQLEYTYLSARMMYWLYRLRVRLCYPPHPAGPVQSCNVC